MPFQHTIFKFKGQFNIDLEVLNAFMIRVKKPVASDNYHHHRAYSSVSNFGDRICSEMLGHARRCQEHFMKKCFRALTSQQIKHKVNNDVDHRVSPLNCCSIK